VTITAVALSIEPIGRLLSPDEYDALPENPRRELVDGVVHVMATPTPWHQDVKIALVNALRRLAPSWLRVTSEIEVRLDELQRRNPDVLLVRADGFSRRTPSLRPDQVVLAVEVVSPGSESMDRVAKPAQYAAAGIAHYWRIEIEPHVTIYTYRLGGQSVAAVPTSTGLTGTAAAGTGSPGADQPASGPVAGHPTPARSASAQVGGPGPYVHTGTFDTGDVVAAPGLEWACFNVRDLAEDE
jgi:Uma2 family endonuclease